MNNICQLKAVYKSYLDGEKKQLSILENINLTIKTTDKILITGKSGSGKSTLLYLLGGLDLADKGEVFFNNKNAKQFTTQQLCEWRSNFLGFVFQFHYLLPDFTALENIYLAGLIAQKDSPQLKKKALNLLESVGLGARAKHKPAQLSGGEQQRVAIARALINSPKLILADEPTGNLDIETGELVFQLLQKITTENKSALVLVTHNQELMQYFSQSYFLAKGNLAKK